MSRTITPGDYVAMVGRIIRAAGRRVAEADPEELALLVGLHDDLDQAINAAVMGQRATGITWQSIGEALGTSKQAAIQKWKER